MFQEGTWQGNELQLDLAKNRNDGELLAAINSSGFMNRELKPRLVFQ